MRFNADALIDVAGGEDLIINGEVAKLVDTVYLGKKQRADWYRMFFSHGDRHWTALYAENSGDELAPSGFEQSGDEIECEEAFFVRRVVDEFVSASERDMFADAGELVW